MTDEAKPENLLFFYDNTDWASEMYSLLHDVGRSSIDVCLRGDAETTGDLEAAKEVLWDRVKMDLRLPASVSVPEGATYPSEPGFFPDVSIYLQAARFSSESGKVEGLSRNRDLGHVKYALEAIKRPDWRTRSDSGKVLLRNCRGFIVDLDGGRVRRLSVEQWDRYLARSDRSERLDGTDG